MNINTDVVAHYLGIPEGLAIDLLIANWIPIVSLTSTADESLLDMLVDSSSIDKLVDDLKKAKIIKEDILDFDAWYALVYVIRDDGTFPINTTLQAAIERFVNG